MSKLSSLILIVGALIPAMVRAASPAPSIEPELTFKEVFTKFPETSKNAFNRSFAKDSIPAWAGILGSTAALYYYDEDILSSSQAQGRRWTLSNSDNTKTFAKLGQYDLLRLPTDGASALYFLGDGWLHTWIAGGFVAAGKLSKNTHALNTGYELLNGMIVSTVYNQALKHAFGRQSPGQKTEPRGKWRPFPSINSYNARTAEYDAMPSGHIMTATMVFTIIRGNYPEYDSYLLPIEVVWVSALGFGMMNNGVHWISDYPIGIAMGYVFGKAALDLGKTTSEDESRKASNSIFFPSVFEGTLTANWIGRF